MSYYFFLIRNYITREKENTKHVYKLQVSAPALLNAMTTNTWSFQLLSSSLSDHTTFSSKSRRRENTKGRKWPSSRGHVLTQRWTRKIQKRYIVKEPSSWFTKHFKKPIWFRGVILIRRFYGWSFICWRSRSERGWLIYAEP